MVPIPSHTSSKLLPHEDLLFHLNIGFQKQLSSFYSELHLREVSSLLRYTFSYLFIYLFIFLFIYLFSYLLFIYLFIYLFMAVLGLRFCARAFSSCGERGPLFIAVRGPLTIAASLVAEHRLQSRRLSSCGSRA